MLEVSIPTWPDPYHAIIFITVFNFQDHSLYANQRQCQIQTLRLGGGGASRTLDKGGPVPPQIFLALWASVWSKNKRGHRVPSPRSATEWYLTLSLLLWDYLQVVSWHQITCDISVVIIVLYFLPSPSFSISSRKPLLSSISWRTTWRNNKNKYYFWFNFYFYK